MLAALYRAVAEDLTHRFGQGHWFVSANGEGRAERSAEAKVFANLDCMHQQSCRRYPTLGYKEALGHRHRVYFTAAERPLYLTGMAVHPDLQRKGIGRLLLKEAEAVARAWSADAIRLDAFDAEAGAGTFMQGVDSAR